MSLPDLSEPQIDWVVKQVSEYIEGQRQTYRNNAGRVARDRGPSSLLLARSHERVHHHLSARDRCTLRVPLDKSEGVVKTQNPRAVFCHALRVRVAVPGHPSAEPGAGQVGRCGFTSFISTFRCSTRSISRLKYLGDAHEGTHRNAPVNSAVMCLSMVPARPLCARTRSKSALPGSSSAFSESTGATPLLH